MSQNPYDAPNSDSTGSKVVLGCTIAGAIGIGLMVVLFLFGMFAFRVVRSSGPPPVAPVPSVKPVSVEDAIPEPPPALDHQSPPE